MTAFTLASIPYLYPGGRRTVMWLLVAVLTTAVAWRLAPAAWRPRSHVVPVAAIAFAYLALNASFRSGFVQWLDHDVFERFRGGVDDISTWLVAAAGATVGIAAVTLLGRGDRH